MDETAEQLPAAVLFDLDGTLVDSLPDLMLALNKTRAEAGRRPASRAEVGEWVGDGVRMLVARGLEATGGIPEGGPERLVERFMAFYGGHTVVETRPYPGVEAALRALKADRHPLGVCTNKPTRLSLELLDGLGMTPMFDAVVGGDSLPVRKPDPGHLRGTLAAMGAEGRRAVMVGDGRNDVAAARAAGIPVVLFGHGYAGGDPRALGADAVIDDFAELVPVLRGLLGSGIGMAEAGNSVVRPLRPADREAWMPLWQGYQEFYKVRIAPEVSDATWGRLLDPAEPMAGALAWRGGDAVGLVHFIRHRSCWTIGDYCYLQDLFVSPGRRGGGIGRRLIEHVYETARAEGCSRVHWLTHETNSEAMKLYDRIGERSGFVQYRHLLTK